MKSSKKKPQRKKSARPIPTPNPAPKPEPVLLPAVAPLPGMHYIPDIEAACAAQQKLDEETIGRICTLSNDDVLDGYVHFEDIAKVTRLLLMARIHPDDVKAVRAGVEIYEKFHLRGLRSRLVLADHMKPDGALTEEGIPEDVTNDYVNSVFPTTEEWRRRNIINFPAKVFEHPVISKLMHTAARFCIVAAGGRSWKTMIAILFTISQAIRRPKTSYYLAAPTRSQAKLIFWERLNQFSPKATVHSIRVGELIIYYKNGSEIHVVSLDVPARIEGKSTWHGAVIDEAGDAAYNVFDMHVRATLSDSKGWCWIIGRARQTKSPYFKELKTRALNGAEGYEFFTWKSSDILDPDEIADIKSTTSPAVYAQEYDAEFQDALGRAYSYYDADVHKKEIAFDKDNDLVVACDFNVNPCVWEMGQEMPGRFFNVFDEVTDVNTDTFKMVTLLKKRILALHKNEQAAKLHRMDFYGDYAGTQRTTNATYSNWKIIREAFEDWNATFHLKPSPHIIDRVNAVNGRMRSADAGVHFAVSEKAKLLRADFENLSLEQVMKEKEAEQTLTHASDALGYWIESRMGGMTMTVGGVGNAYQS